MIGKGGCWARIPRIRHSLLLITARSLLPRRCRQRGRCLPLWPPRRSPPLPTSSTDLVGTKMGAIGVLTRAAASPIAMIRGPPIPKVPPGVMGIGRTLLRRGWVRFALISSGVGARGTIAGLHIVPNLLRKTSKQLLTSFGATLLPPTAGVHVLRNRFPVLERVLFTSTEDVRLARIAPTPRARLDVPC